MDDKIKTFSYVRVSGLGQAAKGKDGFTRQREVIQDYATRNDIEIVQEFKDEGISGTRDTFDRPGLTDLFVALKSNGVKLVLAENADRIGRDLMVSEIILAEFRKIGVKVIAADSGTDLTVADDEPTRKLIRQILGAISEFDKTRLVQKLRAARARKRRAGERVEGKKPYGTREGEQAVIERMKTLRNEGLSFASIAAKLNGEGIKPRKGVKWHPTPVKRILDRIKPS